MLQRMMLLFILVTLRLYSQSLYDLNKYIENPTMVAENQEPPHVPLVVYDSFEQAKFDDRERSPYFLSLNGTWKFNWSWNPQEAPDHFFDPNVDVSEWDEISVPSVWQMQGYGRNMYRNIPQALQPYNPPFVPDDINPTGCYRTTFYIPYGWQDRQIFLHFEGVKSCAFVWLNGQYVGYDQGGMTSAEFNITDKLQFGENTLAVKVIRWTDGSYLEDQDMWRFSGIYRDVYLFSTPNRHIRDFFIKTDLDENYVNGRLTVDVDIQKYVDVKPDTVSVRGILLDANGDTAATAIKYAFFNATKTAALKLETAVDSVKKWSAEKPYLYTLILSLHGYGDSLAFEYLAEKVGFRKLEMKNGLALVNGVAIDFMGVNKHEHHPQFGRTMTEEMMRKDIELMKQFNVNAVRLSHYPNDPLWYELCDEYGIYLQDEVNAECHYNVWDMPRAPAMFPAFMDRFERMVQSHKNFPSVVMWSTGNECGIGPVHDMMNDYVRAVDPGRFVMHQDFSGGADFTDIHGPRYQTPAQFLQLAKTSEKPIVSGEYAHAMGNSLGHFDEFWTLFRDYDNLQGGFIWDWVDQGLWFNLSKSADMSKMGNDGFLMGRPQLVEGKFGNAVELSGLDDWVEFYRDPSLDFTDQVTLECWVYPRTWENANPFICKGDAYGLNQFHEDSLEFYISHPGQKKSRVTTKLPINWAYNWHHIAGVFDGQILQLFIDEQEMAAVESAGAIDPGYFPPCIGRNAQRHHQQYAGWLSNALIDNVRMYGRALVPEELGLQEKPLRNDAVVWLDFEETEPMPDYLSYGVSPFCINGVVFPDRSIQPETWQMKKSHQPVKIDVIDVETANVRIDNYFDFTHLNEYTGRWSIAEDQKIIASDSFTIDVAPRSFGFVNLDLPKISPMAGKTYWLRISFHLSQKTAWAPAGHEIAFEQFELPYFSPEPQKREDFPRPKISENDEMIRIDTGHVSYTFDKNRGGLGSAFSDGLEILKSGPVLNLYRPPILNETADWGKAEADEWRAVGLDRMIQKMTSLSLDTLDHFIQIVVDINSITPDSTCGFGNEFVYSFYGNGEVLITHRAWPIGEFKVEYLPKFGLQFHVPKVLDQFVWYGRGPFETYPDRKTAANMGIYSGSVDEQYVPYLVPQDHGNKTDVRWASLTNKNGVGFKIIPDEPLNVSVTKFNNIERAEYAWQLQKGDTILFNIDKSVSGVGGTPVNARPPYRTMPQEYNYSIRFVPIK